MWSGVKNCSKAAYLPAATQKRLVADLRRLQDEPIPLAAAQPCGDGGDLTLWDGVIGVEMDVTHFGVVTVPLHFLIDFPADYPQSAPNIGFSFEFEYRGGAQYVMPDGRLRGKKVICLDVLGNFGNYHQEWKKTVGSGWSPAYTVTTLLVQLQSVLCDLGNQMSQREREVTYQSAVRFCEKSPSSVLEIFSEDELQDRRQERRTQQRLSRICGGDDALCKRARRFIEGFSSDEKRLDEFLSLLNDVAMGELTHQKGTNSSASSNPEAREVDQNICCFATGKLYTEALLGVGVGKERRNLSTAAELLSLEAFDDGLRQSTNKSPFEYFLPVWVNEAHAAQRPEWCNALKKSYMEIGAKVFETRDEDVSIIEVFPRLINQMIVEMMKPDASKSAAIATFEALCNFWRTLRWLVDTRPTLRDRIGTMLSNFVSSEGSRHKDKSPDLGVVLVLFTAFQGHSGCPPRGDFMQAYFDENSVRWVMWWQRAGTKPEPLPVFQATQVSREICMFQLMVVDLIIKDVPVTLKEIESTNCKLPERLEKLQVHWRQQKAATSNWDTYFRHIQVPAPGFVSETAWIESCVTRAMSKGPKYGGGKGEGKGDSKGKGKGKGWSKGR